MERGRQWVSAFSGVFLVFSALPGGRSGPVRRAPRINQSLSLPKAEGPQRHGLLCSLRLHRLVPVVTLDIAYHLWGIKNESAARFEGLPPSPVTARLRGLGSQQLPLVSLSWDGSPAQYAGLWTAQRDPEACAYASVRLTGTRSRCLSTACFEALRDSHTFLFFFPPFSNPSESFIYSSVRAFIHLCNTHSFCVSLRSRH